MSLKLYLLIPGCSNGFAGVLISLFLTVTSTVLADGPVATFKSAMQHTVTGDLYVSTGYPVNHDGYEAALDRLWEKAGDKLPRDSYRQEWKQIEPGELRSVFGHFDTQYYLLFPIVKRVDSGNGYGRIEFAGYAIERREVTGAALFRWGCGGEVIPVLNLGPWPSDTYREWGPLAISIHGKFGEARLVELDKSLVPEAYARQVANTEQWVTIEWPDVKYRATVTHHTFATGEASQHIFATGDSPGYFSFLEPRWPMDYRC
ncbi:MAG TPA: hypothetical protein ENO07_05655 [candidate division Zixibacteria bacterium]|nr:hypothetical protein [candidate division Zixibacteria bacterium]